MISYRKNDLIDECLKRYYETFAQMLDTVDFVPARYNARIQRYIFKNMRRTFRAINFDDWCYCREMRKKKRAERRAKALKAKQKKQAIEEQKRKEQAT